MLRDYHIDYSLLAKACEYYEYIGYVRVEVPWIVPRPIIDLTVPKEFSDTVHTLTDGRCIVGSAEQGFIEAMLSDRLLPDTKYYSVSPCFRGDVEDATHSEWFMKLELFSYGGPRYLDFLDDARAFFAAHGIKTNRVVSDMGLDLEDAHGLELGSYGSRTVSGTQINYGTGLALPRFNLSMGCNFVRIS